MNAFQFHLPTRILFGSDTIAQTGEAVKAAGGSRVLVLDGTGSVQRNGVLDKVLAALDGQKIPYCVEGGIQPNPRLAKAQALADTYAGKGIDFLLGVGGASVLDTCKAVAIGLACGGSIWDYFCKVRPISRRPACRQRAHHRRSGQRDQRLGGFDRRGDRQQAGLQHPLQPSRFCHPGPYPHLHPPRLPDCLWGSGYDAAHAWSAILASTPVPTRSPTALQKPFCAR